MANGNSADAIFDKNCHGLSGDLHTPRSNDKMVELTIKESVDDARALEGISGGPVFVNQRLFACISDARCRFEGNRVWATPIWPSLPSEIKECFTDTAFQKQASQQITRVLAESGDFLKALAASIGCERCEASEVATQLLFRSTLLEALDALFDVLDNPDKLKGSSGARAASKEIAGWLWPARAHEFPASFEPAKRRGVVTAHSAQAALYIEGTMAAADGASAILVVSSDSRHLCGRWAIHLPPEIGWEIGNVIPHLQKELDSRLPNHGISLSGESKDLADDLAGLARLREVAHKRGRPDRQPFLVVDQNRADNSPIFALDDQLSGSVPGLVIWQMKLDQNSDPDARAIAMRLYSIMSNGKDTGGPHAASH
jgi:hypothetical protein